MIDSAVPRSSYIALRCSYGRQCPSTL